MKTITLNHQEIQIQEDCTLARLLEDKGLTGGGIAAAVNNRVIPRKDWDVTLLNDNDLRRVMCSSLFLQELFLPDNVIPFQILFGEWER